MECAAAESFGEDGYLTGWIAVRYEPAAGTLEVGGDWYDVVDLPGGRHGVVDIRHFFEGHIGALHADPRGFGRSERRAAREAHVAVEGVS